MANVSSRKGGTNKWPSRITERPQIAFAMNYLVDALRDAEKIIRLRTNGSKADSVVLEKIDFALSKANTTEGGEL